MPKRQQQQQPVLMLQRGLWVQIDTRREIGTWKKCGELKLYLYQPAGGQKKTKKKLVGCTELLRVGFRVVIYSVVRWFMRRAARHVCFALLREEWMAEDYTYYTKTMNSLFRGPFPGENFDPTAERRYKDPANLKERNLLCHTTITGGHS